MCVPAIGMVAGLAGSMVSAMGAMQQSKAQAQQDEYNATVAKINARTERQVGYRNQEDIGMKAERTQGAATAAMAAGGIDPTYGSAASVIFGEGAEMEARDKSTAYVNAEGKAVGEENKAKAYEASAENHRKAGKIAAMGSFLGGLGGAFKGGGDSSLKLNATA